MLRVCEQAAQMLMSHTATVPWYKSLDGLCFEFFFKLNLYLVVLFLGGSVGQIVCLHDLAAIRRPCLWKY